MGGNFVLPIYLPACFGRKSTQTQLVHEQKIKIVTKAQDETGNPGDLRWQCYLRRHHAACLLLLLWIISIMITALPDRAHTGRKVELNQMNWIKMTIFVSLFPRPTITEMCRMRSSSSAAVSLAGSSVVSTPAAFWLPSWWWMWKSSVPFSSHCCLQRTKAMSSELPEISAITQTYR